MDGMDQTQTHELLAALGEQLAAQAVRFELVVIGGSALLALTVHFASRIDQIHFKLYAMVDQGAGKHEADLRALAPTTAELLEAARWTRTHDPSEGFREELVAALA